MFLGRDEVSNIIRIQDSTITCILYIVYYVKCLLYPTSMARVHNIRIMCTLAIFRTLAVTYVRRNFI